PRGHLTGRDELRDVERADLAAGACVHVGARRVGGAEVDADQEAGRHARSPGPDVELELPALPAVTRDAPERERADLGDLRLQAHRHGAALLTGAGERGLERRQLLQLALTPGLDHRARTVAPANRRPEEPELGGLAHDQPELRARELHLAALLHA